jgi:hypothetical protein
VNTIPGRITPDVSETRGNVSVSLLPDVLLPVPLAGVPGAAA